MGLLDILNGMQNGPRGQQQPKSSGEQRRRHVADHDGSLGTASLQGAQGEERSGCHSRRRGPAGAVTARRQHECRQYWWRLGDILGGLLGGKPGGAPTGAKPGGGLGDLLPGGLGGLLGGAAAGSVLSGGLGNLIKELQDSGHGHVAQSWVGTGANQEIAPNDLASALGGDTLATLSQQTGIGHEDLLAGLSQHLPDLINQLTPHGRLPTEEEASRMV